MSFKLLSLYTLKSDDDDKAQKPMDLRYMKLLRITLTFIFTWPHSVFGTKQISFFFRNPVTLFIEGSFTFLSGIYYIWSNFNTVSFVEMGNTYLTVLLSLVSAQRVTISWFKAYHSLMKEFMLNTHLFYHRHKSEFSEKIYQKVHRICHVIVVAMVTLATCGVTLFNIGPLINNYNKGMFKTDRPPDKRYEASIEYVLPFIDQRHDLKPYIGVTLANMVFSYDCCMYFSAVDSLIIVIVFHIWGHLQILDNNLRSIQTPVEMRGDQPGAPGEELRYTDEENLKIGKILKSNIEHHKMIKGVMNITSDAFGPTLLLYYMFYQVTGCILLLECSSMDAKSLVRYAPVTLTLYVLLVQISVVVELLGSQSETLKDAVYSVPWEYMNTSNRKVVFFFLCNVQEPIRLKPMGMVSVGVTTMATILKTSVSYFLLLKTFT